MPTKRTPHLTCVDVCVIDGLWVDVTDGVCVYDGDCVAVCEAVPVRDGDCVRVIVTEGVIDRVTLGVRVCVLVCEGVRDGVRDVVRVIDLVELCDCVPEVGA